MAGIVIAFAILAIGFGVIESIWPARPQKRWRRGMATDLAYWIFTPLVSRALAVLAIVVIAVAVAKLSGLTVDQARLAAFVHRATWFGELPRAVQISLVLVVGDLIGYWLHRGFHRRVLWRFHAVHHSSVDLDWLSATRLHPVNDIATRSVQAFALLGLGFDPTVVAGYVPALALFAIALHANVRWTFGPLRYVIASPTFHRWHHTSQTEGLDKNFAGLLPVWDLMFGTFYLPRQAQPTVFGVSDPVPEGIIGQLTWPFRSRRSAVSAAARSPGAGRARR